MKPGMPTLIHYSDQDCIYRIDGRNFPRDMLKITVDKFPEQLQECRAFVQVAGTLPTDDLVGTAISAFDSMETVERFGSSVFNTQRFTLIKLTNCFYNSEAIAIKLDRVKSNIHRIISFVFLPCLKCFLYLKFQEIPVFSRATK